MAINTQKLTVDAFWEQYAGQPYELVNGEVIAMPPAGYEAASIARRIAMYLGLFVDENDLGDVLAGDGGYKLDEITLRAPDASFVSKAKLAGQFDRSKYLNMPPDLAVEVVSPNDRAGEVRQKVALYLEKGVRMVWVVYPSTRIVDVYGPDGAATPYKDGDTLSGGDVLPGFTLPVTSIFPAQESE
ncbi:MAG: Uma2 family endonuclease [Chloroflexota bacterium]